MKTTIDIPDALYEKAKIRAIERGLTLKQIVLTSLSKELEPASTGPAPGQSIKERRKLLPRYAKSELFGMVPAGQKLFLPGDSNTCWCC